jgi:hypothetical protein
MEKVKGGLRSKKQCLDCGAPFPGKALFCGTCGKQSKEHRHAVTQAGVGTVCVNSGAPADIRAHAQTWALPHFVSTELGSAIRGIQLTTVTPKPITDVRLIKQLRERLAAVTEYVAVITKSSAPVSTASPVAVKK